MGATIEFFYDFTCPFAYLGSTQIEGVCARTDATLSWRPFLLGGLFRDLYQGATAVPSPVAPKAAHAGADLRRWAAWWDIPLAYPSGHPIRPVSALRSVLANPGREAAITHRVYRAYWVEHQDIADDDVLATLLTEVGCDPVATLAAEGEARVKDALRANTDEALARGVFGAPTCFVDGDFMVWGQDRLDFVERAATGWRPPEP